jgi:hypothetical protein
LDAFTKREAPVFQTGASVCWLLGVVSQSVVVWDSVALSASR